ncbi:SH3 domain-containing kinase-binding protein 1 [Bagarius yarrelli]|uniref:SH3 domain-containing kinase-binding protein 1 n=1 Tax=Bagarius yarrelli TaxID=175774 RepID=A0A556VVM2_BAGYA|nr:SH3 domain-containing kinase-binding protein 1 [Bagarius yarrelli]
MLQADVEDLATPPEETRSTRTSHRCVLLTVKEFCKVLFPYDAQNEDELSIKEGDIVSIVSKAPEKSSKPSGLSTSPGAPALMETKVKSEQGSNILEELRVQLRELRATVELMKSQHKQEMKQLVSELDDEKKIRLSLQMDVENIKKVLSK